MYYTIFQKVLKVTLFGSAMLLFLTPVVKGVGIKSSVFGVDEQSINTVETTNHPHSGAAILSKKHLLQLANYSNDCQVRDRDDHLVNLIIQVKTVDDQAVLICGENRVPKTFEIITASPDGENEEHIADIHEWNVSNPSFESSYDSVWHQSYRLTKNYLEYYDKQGRRINRYKVKTWKQLRQPRMQCRTSSGGFCSYYPD